LERLNLDGAFVMRRAQARARADEISLLREEIAPVCSPKFLQDSRLRDPSDLARCRLIECDEAAASAPEFGWSNWLEHFRLPTSKGPWSRFGDPGLAIAAAIDGLGVALGRSPMIDAELAAGRLVKPFPQRVKLKARQIYAFKWRQPAHQRTLAFRDFALDEACGCELAAGPCGMPRSAADQASSAALGGDRAALRTLSR
jgi:LysR family glycine cleavage system transcriptional activator